MSNVNDKLKVVETELKMLMLAVKENWWSDEEVLEKLRGIIDTVESAMKENTKLKHDLLLLVKKLS